VGIRSGQQRDFLPVALRRLDPQQASRETFDFSINDEKLRYKVKDISLAKL
jgi:hypothetical protein